MTNYHIICSAVREVETGEVWFGPRHSDAIFLMHQFRGGKGARYEEGFWVIGSGERGSFVDRLEAAKIALANGQISEPASMLHPGDSDLYSEDLW